MCWLPAGQTTLSTFLGESASASIMIGGVSKHSEHRPGLSSLKDSRDAKCQVWGVLWDKSGLIPSGLSCTGIKSICLHSHFLYVEEHICIGKRSLTVTWRSFSQYMIQYLLTKTDWLSLSSSNALQQNLEILSVAVSEVKLNWVKELCVFTLNEKKKKIPFLSLQFSLFYMTPGGRPYVSLLWQIQSSINTSLTHYLG